MDSPHALVVLFFGVLFLFEGIMLAFRLLRLQQPSLTLPETQQKLRTLTNIVDSASWSQRAKLLKQEKFRLTMENILQSLHAWERRALPIQQKQLVREGFLEYHSLVQKMPPLL